ncbi:EAL domain-containing protein [Zoogloea sp.]|uniref:EAL domain-containing protein n=1 Tax=Zoogloea sp. TaxID=49181 RepID=UPI002631FAB3|nr:EAL domain-containing protein [Zoogloea sp.]MDD3354961.1 EAL domain-containing protein [Zoogloea sp.]
MTADPCPALPRPSIPPGDEDARLARLHALRVLDTAPEALFDGLASAAATVCDTPIALISLIDDKRQWFKANVGLPGLHELPRGQTPCAEALLAGSLLEISDVRQEARFRDCSLVGTAPGIRFYAGVPLRLSDGCRAGTLCVMDYRPRALDARQHLILDSLAGTVTQALELREQARNALQSATEQTRLTQTLLDHVLEGIITIDDAGRILSFNREAERIFGFGAAEVIGRHAGLLLPEDGVARIERYLGAPAPDQDGAILDRGREGRGRRRNGEIFPLELDVSRSPMNGRAFYVGVIRDISQRRHMEHRLAESLDQLQVTLDSIADAVITTDVHGTIRWLNPAAERMTGWGCGEATGRPLGEVFTILDETTRKVMPDPVARCLALGRTVGKSDQPVLISRDGSEYGIEKSAAPIRDDEGSVHGAVLVFRDVSERRQLSREMTHRATHDALTGLVNRAELEARVRRLLEHARSHRGSSSLIFIDLDHFKAVNDACGHLEGDKLLKQVSSLLLHAVRARDTVARMGGDEFAVILEHCDVSQGLRIAQKICGQMEDFRFICDGRAFRVGTSIGLVPLDERWPDAAQLFQAADSACYIAKETGRNRVHVWMDSVEGIQLRQGEMQWVERLEQALDEDRFELFAQRILPVAAARARADVELEILLRLREPDGSLVGPGAFLPAAERFHLATRIDRWVVRHAFEWLTRNHHRQQVGLLSINLSAQSLSDRAFPTFVEERARETGFPLSRLCLEITESTVIGHRAEAVHFTRHMHQLGARIAIDDFGSGASSFGYLRDLSVDFIKIDGQFITGLLDDPLDQASVKHFMDLAQVVQVGTIAEFVERQDVLEALGLLGIERAQGALLHQPEPLDSLSLQAVSAT